MEPTNRIIKDISARKTGKDMHEAMEMAAVKASQQAYWNSILAGYQTKIKEMESEHELQLEKMQADHEKTVRELDETRASMVNDAILQKEKDSDRQFGSLKTTISELETEKRTLQASLGESEKNHQVFVDAAKRDRARGDIQIANLKKSHAKDMQKLQKQLEVGPNSWVSFQVKRKRAATKTYIRRPTASFSEAIKEYEDMATKSCSHGFRHYHIGSQKIGPNSLMTLQQLGIKDNDEISRESS